ncbi:NUDIX hydrolase [Ruegeria sediminis]|uniref:NUDIX hydrolase n=1 Tax=Ruegeria sediminis TaxID=2583820 RepID=A0ABY2WZ14_9RHOB|nr:NUDIX hydrolase [Ruegeria sediminis]TMV07742.1 NUDIX hydrolase [Ruegeria sediminis]
MNAKLSTNLQRDAGSSPVHLQYGALCYRLDDGKLQVLLVTSRETGRWVIPKGWPIDDTEPSETAAHEAWEEAGVVGSCKSKSVGSFSYTKVRPSKGNVLCLVKVYPLRVRKLVSDFPESGQRRRKWFSVKKAAQRVAEPGLVEILREFSPRLLN